MTNPLTRAILAVEIALANDASPEAIVPTFGKERNK